MTEQEMYSLKELSKTLDQKDSNVKILNKIIESFKKNHGIDSFLVSGTVEIYLKAKGFKEFLEEELFFSDRKVFPDVFIDDLLVYTGSNIWGDFVSGSIAPVHSSSKANRLIIFWNEEQVGGYWTNMAQFRKATEIEKKAYYVHGTLNINHIPDLVKYTVPETTCSKIYAETNIEQDDYNAPIKLLLNTQKKTKKQVTIKF